MSALPAVVAKQVLTDDLSTLSDEDKVALVAEVTRTLRIEPATMPLRFITLDGRVVLYVTKDGTDQLRNRDDISTEIVSRVRDADLDVYSDTARARRPDGRHEESMGAVTVRGLAGEALANAMMKAETKAKRRATLSICGLGFLDESEVGDIPAAEGVEAPAGPAMALVARAAYDQVATEADGWSSFARNLLADSIEELTEGQRDWLKVWCRGRPGPDGRPWPNVHNRQAFTIDHGPILAEWIAMAREYSPPCEEDSEKAPKDSEKAPKDSEKAPKDSDKAEKSEEGK